MWRLAPLFLMAVAQLAMAADLAPAFQIPYGKVSFDDNPMYSSADFNDTTWETMHWSTVEEKGIWWFRSELSLPDTWKDSPQPLALYINAVASSQIWVDGVEVGQNGKPSSNAASEVPGFLNVVIPLTATIADGKPHQIAIRFSSQQSGSRIMSPVDALFIGPFGSPLRWQQRSYLPTIVVAGAIGLSTLFLIALTWWSRSKRPAWLLVGSFFALLQMVFEVSRAFVNYPYHWHEWRLMSISICASITSLAIIAYLAERFSTRHQQRIVSAIAVAFIVMLVFIPQSELVSLLTLFIAISGGLIICASSVVRRQMVGMITAAALAALFIILLINPGGFLDRYYYYGIAALLLLFFVEHVIDYARTTRHLDQALVRSTRLRLELLKQYLRPHFLLNTLTSLSEWFEQDQKIGHRMIQVLSQELRLLEQFIDKALIPIEDELALCRLHLELYGYRQDQQFQLVVHGPDSNLEIPPAVIHTLIENALTHNQYNADLTQFNLSISHDQNRVRLQLSTPTATHSTTPQTTVEGAGLRYVRARLEESFGAGFQLISNQLNGQWVTKIDIPKGRRLPVTASTERLALQ